MTDKELMITEVSLKGADRYEELLLRRDNLRKQAEQYQISYFREFGDLMVESFRIRIDCIKKKKIIAYCQQQVNHGKAINGAQLDHFITREMLDYQNDLEAMIARNKAVREAGRVSEHELFRIKKIYHGLAKLIHPDLHPELEGDPKIREFWNRIVIAYEHNQLDDIEDLDFQVRQYLESIGGGAADVAIPDLDKKIRRVEDDIENIISTEPYLYKLLLADAEAVEARKAEIREEIRSYTEYAKQLEGLIAQFDIERNYS